MRWRQRLQTLWGERGPSGSVEIRRKMVASMTSVSDFPGHSWTAVVLSFFICDGGMTAETQERLLFQILGRSIPWFTLETAHAKAARFRMEKAAVSVSKMLSVHLPGGEKGNLFF